MGIGGAWSDDDAVALSEVTPNKVAHTIVIIDAGDGTEFKDAEDLIQDRIKLISMIHSFLNAIL
ncbi:hypothetical protein KUL152_15210 [Tenacibaculum sp. KUL152]|nr:hypothetical protein KUL152_15210 [Tenacibaculum sp. KUL152]